ncbi:hypothetical protein [Pseudomonas sp. S11A4]|uniref:hypothetical protein n=1 Tax=Pseudomonas sp. S11A4 TaxID=1476791 RepID=UPI00215C313A|nr:hypothetical protein [Pseudomonas sp. S11A4]MCR8935731.1 hypothetical protein [Pseudomonas sp. S11A4]
MKKKELYTFHDDPVDDPDCTRQMASRTWHVKEIHEDLIETGASAPRPSEHPSATARAYLEFARGLARSQFKASSRRKRISPAN